MEKTIKYKANDGKEFHSEAKCLEYEAVCSRIAEIMSQMPALPKDDGCRFANGGGYIQHRREIVSTVKVQLLDVAKMLCPDSIKHWIEQTQSDPTVHLSWAARAIYESGNDPLYFAWSRLMCIDSNFREYGQPYFVTHPEIVEQFEIYGAEAEY